MGETEAFLEEKEVFWGEKEVFFGVMGVFLAGRGVFWEVKEVFWEEKARRSVKSFYHQLRDGRSMRPWGEREVERPGVGCVAGHEAA